VTQQQVKGGSRGQPGLLTRSAQAALQAMVQQYQEAARAANLQFVLHGGDGVALCAAGSSLGDSARFPAIDCSNMGDHAGEMPLPLHQYKRDKPLTLPSGSHTQEI